MSNPLTLAALILPLGFDTFALSLAFGLAGITARERLRVSLIMTAFEGAMPLIGFFIGAGVGVGLGRIGNGVAVAVLVAVACYMLWPGKGEEREAERAGLLRRTRGLALIGIGLSVSIDELAIGFGIGLLRAPLLLLVALIALQALVAGQLGMRLGSKLGEGVGELAERIGGVLLLVAAGLVLSETLL